MGGSGKRQLADGSWIRPNTIGKLRRLRLPPPPLVFRLERAGSFTLRDKGEGTVSQGLLRSTKSARRVSGVTWSDRSLPSRYLPSITV
jgi:hypothetical protein